jgi:hypothetical protein
MIILTGLDSVGLYFFLFQLLLKIEKNAKSVKIKVEILLI